LTAKQKGWQDTGGMTMVNLLSSSSVPPEGYCLSGADKVVQERSDLTSDGDSCRWLATIPIRWVDKSSRWGESRQRNTKTVFGISACRI
jgi:hypothetical protein